MEFVVRGAREYNEPGVFMAFEETAADLTANVRSLGFDLEKLTEEKKLVVDYVRVERSEIDETGDYDLEGLRAYSRALQGLGTEWRKNSRARSASPIDCRSSLWSLSYCKSLNRRLIASSAVLMRSTNCSSGARTADSQSVNHGRDLM
jgi:hypothetical protein